MRQTITRLRQRTSPASTAVRGLARRAIVSLTKATGLWQLLGLDGLDGERETWDDVEVFGGIGFHSRPRAGSKAEVVVVHIGGESGHPIAVATRDMGTQLQLEEDETAIFTSGGQVKITKDGDITIRAKAGRTVSVDDGSGAVELALKSDLDALKAIIGGWTPVGGDGGAELKTAITAIAPAGWHPTGTTVLKGK